VSRLRLAIFAPYATPHVGGVESYVDELCSALWAHDAVEDVVVAAPRIPAGTAPRERRPDGTRLVRLPALEPVANYPVPALWRRDALAGLRAVHGHRPDVVISNTRFFTTSSLAGAYARATRARWLHVEHGSDFVQLDGRLTSGVARAYDESVGRLILRAADAVVAISGAVAAFVHRLARRPAEVLYRGLPLAQLQRVDPDRALRDAAAGVPLIVYAGRLIDGKGVRDLVEAVAALPLDVRCAILGDGPRRADLEQAAAASRAPARFLFTGTVPEDAALAAIKAADIVVNPSYTEGLPTSVLLAAASGRAVVATDVGGTGEIVADGRGGLLVPPRRPDALAQALERVAADPALRERLGAEAARDVAARFRWEATVARLAELAQRS
jgi:glycosyltransferase involved in cell wall biosynthesis